MSWHNLYCVHTDILFTMTGSRVLAHSLVLVPVVLPSQSACTPPAETPASVCSLTSHYTPLEHGPLWANVILLYFVDFCFVQLITKPPRVTSMTVCICVCVHLPCPCCQWSMSVCLTSGALRHSAICNRAGSQEAHVGFHMAGYRAPAQSPPTRAHADPCTCLYFASKSDISMRLFHTLFFKRQNLWSTHLKYLFFPIIIWSFLWNPAISCSSSMPTQAPSRRGKEKLKH